MTGPINHPSFNPFAAGCTEQDVDVAISQSIMLGGDSVGITYSETAARLLRECAEWEDDDTYSFRGTEADGDREWRVHLVG